MKPISEILDYYQEDMDAVVEWCESVYITHFSRYFDGERKLYKRLQSNSQPITDSELEDILTNLPLHLFSASEQLSKLRMKHEVVKLKNKELSSKKTSGYASSTEDTSASSAIENQLMSSAFLTVIERVEKEIAFSRELIMSAKKIWDSRRRTDSVNPVNEISIPDDLPEYKQVPSKQSYIK